MEANAISELQLTLANIERTINNMLMASHSQCREIDRITAERQRMLERYTNELLPDLSVSTITKLKYQYEVNTAIDEFLADSVVCELLAKAQPSITQKLLSWLKPFDDTEYLDMLKIRLSASLDRNNYGTLSVLTRRIVMLDEAVKKTRKTINELQRKKMRLRELIDQLLAKKANVQPNTVNRLAKINSLYKSTSLDEDDPVTFPLLTWGVLESVFSNAQEIPPFQGEGGTFGGGGASGGWDDKPADKLPESTAGWQEGSIAVIALDDSLGAFS